jgi:riboflavin synthase
VVEIKDNMHRIQAIQETVSKTNIAEWRKRTLVNLERSMPANGRFDGHIVQGHVDGKALVIQRLETEGQVEIFFSHPPKMGITVAKGSVCVNGISLTVVQSTDDTFSVALIPYTLNNTNLGAVKTGDSVNIEFDIIGKYLQKLQG